MHFYIGLEFCIDLNIDFFFKKTLYIKIFHLIMTHWKVLHVYLFKKQVHKLATKLPEVQTATLVQTLQAVSFQFNPGASKV